MRRFLVLIRLASVVAAFVVCDVSAVTAQMGFGGGFGGGGFAGFRRGGGFGPAYGPRGGLPRNGDPIGSRRGAFARGGRAPSSLGNDRPPRRRDPVVVERRPPRVRPRMPIAEWPRRGRPPLAALPAPVPAARAPASPPPIPPRLGLLPPPGPERGFVPPSPDERRYVPNEVLMTVRSNLAADRLRFIEQRFGLTLLASSRLDLLNLDLRRYRLADSRSVRGTIQAMAGAADIAAAQPNFLFVLQDDADAPRTDGAENNAAPEGETGPPQYAADTLKLADAHRVATGADVLIAVIDTGLDETNPEIAGRIVDRFDAIGGTYRPHAHGTAVAGVIVAHRTLVGIAPDAKILAVRAFDSMATGSGQGTTYDIVRGVDFAVSRKARIINMSFAGPRDALLGAALAEARKRQIVEVAAAGNAGPGADPLYPGAEPGVLAVTATDSQNRLFDMASRGAYVAVAAPGVDILAPSTGAAMQLTSGTSVAAAEASGVVALLLQAEPTMGAARVRQVLSDSGTRLVDPFGPMIELIDAVAALDQRHR